MKKLLAVCLLLASSQLTALAASHSVVVEIKDERKVANVKSAFNGTVMDRIPGTNQYLMKVAGNAPQANPFLGVDEVETNDSVTIRPQGGIGILKMSVKSAEWYAQQPSLKLVRADKAQAFSKGRGVVIADLNSGVDFGHPALRGHLTGGHDFVSERASKAASLNQSSASFLDQSSASFLDQSSASFLDQSSAAFLDQSSAAFLDQSSASFLDQSSASFLDATNPAHGHGTFCAGLLAAVAPDAMIMPLRVFDDKGNADLFMIGQAIYYAVKNGADVINMSFGIATRSPIIRKAIVFAQESGVTVVASAGNNNTNVDQFPASYKDVLSTASTDLMDKKASFSNYGDSVFVTAPGVNIISAYPGGYYALSSGTSFSAPFVAGEAALLISARRNGAERGIAKSAVDIDAKNRAFAGQLGKGRIDMLRALQISNDNNDRNDNDR